MKLILYKDKEKCAVTRYIRFGGLLYYFDLPISTKVLAVRRCILRILKALIVVSMLFISACASTKTRPYQKVKLGMDKSQVLEIIGNPSRSDHVRGADRWSYDDFSEGDRDVVSVYFSEGKVSFVGSDQAYEAQVAPHGKASQEGDGNFKEL